MAPSPKDRVNPKGAPYGSRAPEKRIDTGDMTKSLGTFHKGTNYVPKTGNYTLEKGEAVVPKEKNMMNPYSKITEGAKKSPKKTLKSMHVRPAHDGSHIIEHHHHSPHSMEEHTAPDMKGLMAHMQEHAPTMQAMPPAEEQTGAQAQDSAVGASPAGM
jgi:hypothetical protein